MGLALSKASRHESLRETRRKAPKTRARRRCARARSQEGAASLGHQRVPAHVQGRGEIIASLDFSIKGYHIKVVSSDYHMSTAEAYANIQLTDQRLDLDKVTSTSPDQWESLLQNSFEPHCFAKFPELKEVKEELYNSGALFAMMSGSGSSIYGIYEDGNHSISLPQKFEVNSFEL